MNYLTLLAGLALLMILVWLRGLFSLGEHRREFFHAWRMGWVGIFRQLWLTDFGVVVVTYTSPFSGQGGIVAPTANQASALPAQTAQVFFADTDTQAVITHNWGLPASFPSYLFPEVFFVKSLGGGSDSSFNTGFTFGLTNTNSITMNKLSVGTGSGGTYNVYMRRPNSANL